MPRPVSYGCSRSSHRADSAPSTWGRRTMSTTALEDRIRGCIVGGAVGDALGGPYEGQPGPVTLQSDSPCRLSDDTQLTLATCEAVCADGTVSPASIADRFA